MVVTERWVTLSHLYELQNMACITVVLITHHKLLVAIKPLSLFLSVRKSCEWRKFFWWMVYNKVQYLMLGHHLLVLDGPGTHGNFHQDVDMLAGTRSHRSHFLGPMCTWKVTFSQPIDVFWICKARHIEDGPVFLIFRYCHWISFRNTRKSCEQQSIYVAAVLQGLKLDIGSLEHALHVKMGLEQFNRTSETLQELYRHWIDFGLFDWYFVND